MADAARKKKTVAYRSADLSEVPALNELLGRLGLGALQAGSLESVLGRNDNWIGTTDTGHKVFAKQLHEGDRQARLDRTAHVASVAGPVLRMPRLLGMDAADALLVFEFLPEARTGIDLATADEFTEEMCRQAGRVVAALHDLPPAGFDTAEHPLPPVRALDGLSLAYYVQASSAEVEMWRLLQQDGALVAALRDLRELDRDPGAVRVPVHGDLRLDQFLLTGEDLHLSDFEETRLGDPARDIGAFAGEWLYLAAAQLPMALSAALPVGRSASHLQIVATGVSETERRAPLVRAFLAAYLDARPAARDDAGLLSRAAAYAGWHMLDRMLAGAAKQNRLSAVSKAAAGIGRTLLLDPSCFTDTLGLVA